MTLPWKRRSSLVAEALEGPGLEHAQELDLDRRLDLADLVEEHRPERRADLEPAGPVVDRAGEGAAAVAEQLRLDQGRRQRREVQGEERLRVALRERARPGIERDVAREPDRPRHQLLAGPRGAGDQGRDVAHPQVERALEAPQVVGEDRLPDRGPEARRRQRAADDRLEGVVEGAPDLEEAGEEVLGGGADGGRDPRPVEEALEVGEEVAVEAGPPAVPRLAVAVRALAEDDLQEAVLVAVVEEVERRGRSRGRPRGGSAGRSPRRGARPGSRPAPPTAR